MKIFFDTETTSKAEMKAPASDPRQPHIVSLAALLAEDDGTERGSINLIVKPDGWTIPAEATAIHGISNELANRAGIPLVSVLSAFSMLAACADTVIAHNLDFDYLVAAAAFYRMARPFRLRDMKRFCTMRASTDLCKIPGRYGFKWPKLTEALKILLNEDLQNAHDAMADMRGCARLYFHLINIAAPVAPAETPALL